MRQLLSTWCSVLALLGCFSTAHAAPPSAADAKAVRLVIQAQLNAFAADDAKRAFSYAAPAIRAQFGTPDRFLAMVRTGYPMVYRPASVTFFKPELISGGLVQAVQFADLDGSDWIATYRMQRQRDKSWRINGCNVAPSAGLST